MERTKILIHIQNGKLADVYTSSPIEFKVIYDDNMQDDDKRFSTGEIMHSNYSRVTLDLEDTEECIELIKSYDEF